MSVANAEQKRNKIKIWRGSRESYNKLGIYDFWTRYSVKETDGHYTEYYGTNKISLDTGTLLPVIDILPSVPDSPKLGDRYLIGSNDTSYHIYEALPSQNGEIQWKITPLDLYSVKVIKKGLMEYQVVNGKLITYDIVDCGSY